MLRYSNADERWTPEKVAFFKEHRDRWLRGELKLSDYGRGFKRTKKGLVPVWYAEPLGSRVAIDKAKVFDNIRDDT